MSFIEEMTEEQLTSALKRKDDPPFPLPPGYVECAVCGRLVKSLCENTDQCELYPHAE